MIIDLFQLSDDERRFNFEIPPADIDLEEESARLSKTVKIDGKLKKGIAQTDVEGEIETEIETDCTRCLSPSRIPLAFSFKVVYVTAENYTPDAEAELRGEDLDVAVYDGAQIDLSDVAREQILLNLPARALCRENCQGLCAECGANKNAACCDCDKKNIDPRWSALKDLKRET